MIPLKCDDRMKQVRNKFIVNLDVCTKWRNFMWNCFSVNIIYVIQKQKRPAARSSHVLSNCTGWTHFWCIEFSFKPLVNEPYQQRLYLASCFFFKKNWRTFNLLMRNQDNYWEVWRINDNELEKHTRGRKTAVKKT